ncbi:MAG: hypothetical protein IT542_00705 [Rubellimicrobium sp.]|nr:hypothetical protein [Rubellimicrobium sp.]
MLRALPLLAAAALVTASALPAAAQDVRFEIVNNSSLSLYYFYASPTHDPNWGQDILGNEVVNPGESGTVTIADGEATCIYDMKFVMEDGQEITGQTDICTSARYVLQ